MVHISHTRRSLESLRGRLLKQGLNGRAGDSPLTVNEACDLIRVLIEMADFIDKDCQNSQVRVSPGRFR